MVASPPIPPAPLADYAVNLLSLKAEIASLRDIISHAVAQFKNVITSFSTQHTTSSHKNATQSSHAHPMSSAMETDNEHSMDTNHPNQTALHLPAIIANLKHDIATVASKTHHPTSEYHS